MNVAVSPSSTAPPLALTAELTPVTLGSPSLSIIVVVALSSAVTPVTPSTCMLNFSFPSEIESSMVGTLKATLVTPAGMVSVPSGLITND